MKRKYLWGFLGLLMVGCDQDQSGVITNREPFYQRGYELPLAEAPQTLSRIKNFAKANNIQLLVSTKHFRDGEFSATLIGNETNVTVDNVAKGDVAWVSAVSRHTPTKADMVSLNRYLSAIKLGPATKDQRPPLKSPV